MKSFFLKVCLILLSLIHTFCLPYQGQIERDRARVLAGFPASEITVKVQGRDIHYADTGGSGPAVVFIHGSPGSWDAFANLMSDEVLLKKFRMLSIDRPGFGLSEKGKYEISLQRQAALIQPVIATVKGPLILVGHSFGGAVIARYAVDYPDSVSALIFVAASVDPDLEKVTWYQTVGSWTAVRWILPVDLDTSIQEILPLKGELEKILPLWNTIHVPAFIIQGEDDDLVPAANADFLRKKLNRGPVNTVMAPGLGHFIPWSNPELIKTELLRAAEILSKRTEITEVKP